MWLLEMGLLDVEYYLGGSFPQALTSLLFRGGYISIEGCKKITSLVGVSCMKKRKIEALFKSFLKEEEEEN
jgi:hypothetical protein